MTISQDNPNLPFAILAMDAYNRGYNSGFDAIDEISQVGQATVLNREALGVFEAQYQTWQDMNFYAIAYELNDQTIISYRGTDDYGLNFSSDIWTGWRFGSGDIVKTQLDLASKSAPNDTIAIDQSKPTSTAEIFKRARNRRVTSGMKNNETTMTIAVSSPPEL